MEITIFAGKGGVGKSTVAAAYAIKKATYHPVIAIDYDGGHSLHRVCQIEKPKPNKVVLTKINNFAIALFEQMKFESISDSQKKGKPVNEYLKQFPGDYGLIPFCDMITSFFGAPTEIKTLSKFASLVECFYHAKENKVEDLIIDVEPTAGLERMLTSSEAITRSLMNLRHPSWKARILRKGTLMAMPDIAAYINGPFVQDADKYAGRLKEATDRIKNANYYLVCNPESSPVDEMGNVEEVINTAKGVVSGYVINNIRGGEHEEKQVQIVRSRAKGKPVVEIEHDPRLCIPGHVSRHRALECVGNSFKGI